MEQRTCGPGVDQKARLDQDARRRRPPTASLWLLPTLLPRHWTTA